MVFHQLAKLSDIFFAHLKQQMRANNVVLAPHWNIDHICYRVESIGRYVEMKSHLACFSTELIESQVNGRPIATFKLHEPLVFEGRKIDLVELPAPKPGKEVLEGFEHIEVVTDATFSDLKSLYSTCHFNESGLSKAFNKELQLSFENYAIKFHHLSLESVVSLEANEQVFSAIRGSEVLERLARFDPLVAGTFPLNIFTAESDVDVLVCSEDLSLLSDEITKLYSSFDCFKLDFVKQDEGSYLLAKFNYNDVPFEIFGQSITTVKQRGYKHFQVEERLLKLGGGTLRKKVRELRSSGLKTEPAFASALDLSGDPYISILDLHHRSDAELQNLVNSELK